MSRPGFHWLTLGCGILAAAALAHATTGPTPIDVSGLERWIARYNGPANSRDVATEVVVSGDGARVFVTGESYAAGTDSDYATVAYDATTGLQVWEARYAGPGGSYDTPSGLIVSPDRARVIVTGQSDGMGTESDYATVAYDAFTGVQLWVARYDGPGNSTDNARALAMSPDGARVYVSGNSGGIGTDYDYATVAYDVTTGAKRWEARYVGPGNSFDFVSGLVVSPDGTRVYVTGYNDGIGTDYDYVTVAYSASNGAGRWEARYNSPPNAGDFATGLTVSPSGDRLYVFGTSFGDGMADYFTLAYDTETGARRWETRYDGPSSGGDYASDIDLSPDGTRVYVTGYSEGIGTETDFATVAYDAADGLELWEVLYDGPGHSYDYPADLAVGPDGIDVYVTGPSYDGNIAADYATLTYDAVTGAERWVARYNGPSDSNDGSTALAVSPNSARVYVTGLSYLASFDYVTVAYCTDVTRKPIGCLLGS